MVLYIDTTDFNKTTFMLADGKKLWKKSYRVDPHRSHETLQKLDQFLKKNQDPRTKIQKIMVNKGPGSYTGTRVGIVIAQALGFAWGIPVKAVAKEKFKIGR